MKFKPTAAFWIKALLILAILIAMPYAAPQAIELVLMLDLMGLEAILLYFLYQGRHAAYAVLEKAWEFRAQILTVALLLGGFYLLEPDVLLAHLSGSIVLLTLGGSLFTVALLWLPPLLLSAPDLAHRPLFPARAKRPWRHY